MVHSNDSEWGRVINAGVIAQDQATVNVAGNVTGVRHGAQEPPDPREVGIENRFDVGILTVLTVEMRAVLERLQRHAGYTTIALEGGGQAYTARVPADGGGELRVVALQTLEQGSRSAIEAYHRLRDRFRPRLVLLVGIAGGIGSDVGIGDVVLSDQVTYYDARREDVEGTRRRGQDQAMTSFVKQRLNTFFLRYGDTVPMEPGGPVRILRGPIGSGDAVITDGDSDIIKWLRVYHEKMLAVETEAGAVGQAFYEDVNSDRSMLGWLTIRGITDHADRHDWHERRSPVSDRAALVMERLLPLLKAADEH